MKDGLRLAGATLAASAIGAGAAVWLLWTLAGLLFSWAAPPEDEPLAPGEALEALEGVRDDLRPASTD